MPATVNRTAHRRSRISHTILLLSAACAAIGWTPRAQAQDGAVLTPQQIHVLVLRGIANQHKDDAALDEYERTERVVSRGRDGATHEVTSSVVPHGDTGNLHVELERDGVPTAPAALASQWRFVTAALAGYSNTNDPRLKQDREKAVKRDAERDQMEDAIGAAFRFHWMGRTPDGNHELIELSFEPDPAYKPTVRFTNLYQHLRGTAWFDESSGQVVRVQAELFEDVSFVGGIVAKLYQGAQCTIEQAEVAPGVWFPARYAIDIDGRKFVFGSLSMHQVVDVSGHRRVGPPQEALAIIRRDYPDATVNQP